ncbi:TPR repeat protein [Mucor ambiguus]|uniref:TPR repeat protein n=1 Tax=Mucor ambiguus TaxID=91626 RepID=A0A0C9N7B5_9FUNG|nr:TPR repeat protein [Mucor ambiguus]
MAFDSSNETSTPGFGSTPAPSSTTSQSSLGPAFCFGKPASGTNYFKPTTNLFGSSFAKVTPHDANTLFAMATATYNNVFANSYEDKERALRYFIQAGTLGHVEAQCKVGDLYKEGYSTPQNYGLAIEWYTKAAANGSTAAMLNLGIMSEEGLGRLFKDYTGAYVYYLQAAEREDAEAIYRLGRLYHTGMGVLTDLVRARTYYERAAKQGHVLSSYNAGCMYQFGLGDATTSLFTAPKIDYNKALIYYMQAAKEDYPDALCNVGYLYEKGHGVKLSFEQALHYYQRGAEKGSHQAHQNLGELYLDGKGTSIDLDKAYYHFDVAHKGGITESQEYMNVVQERRRKEKYPVLPGYDTHNSNNNNNINYITRAEHQRIVKEKDENIATLMEQMKMQQAQIDSLMKKLFPA